MSWESHPHATRSLQHLKLRQSPYWRDKRRESPSKLIRKDHRTCACWAQDLLLPPPAVSRRFLSAPRLQLSTCRVIVPDHPARCAARHQGPRVVTKRPGRLSPRKANITTKQIKKTQKNKKTNKFSGTMVWKTLVCLVFVFFVFCFFGFFGFVWFLVKLSVWVFALAGLACFCFARLQARARMQKWRARVKLSKK